MLTNKKIVIIGGTSGIGFSAARAFINEGARVVVVGKDEESCQSAAGALGKSCISIQGEATEEETVHLAIETCVNKFGDFDGLYHVAGGSGRKMGDGPLHELTLEGWHYTLQLNLTSVMLSNRGAVNKFLELGKGGTILNTGSVLGYSPSPKYFVTHAYATAKSAIIGFTKSIAAYYAANNIRANVLAPALVETPMAERATNDPAIMNFIKTKQPLDGGRISQPKDLDGAACFFMSDQSGFATGQVFAIDGGWDVSEGQYEG